MARWLDGLLLLPNIVGGLVLVALVYPFARLVIVTGRAWRGHRIRRYASANRFEYVSRDDAVLDRWPLPPLNTGKRRAARFVVRGAYRGREFVAMQYTRDPADAQSYSVATRFAVVAMRMSARAPEAAYARPPAARWLGIDVGEIDGEAAKTGGPVGAASDAVWALRCASPGFAQALETPPMDEWRRRPAARGQALLFHGQDALLIDSEWPRPDRTAAMLDALADLLDALATDAWTAP